MSQLVAWARLVYAALAFVGLGSSLKAYDLATSDAASAQLSEAALQSEVLAHLAAASSMEFMALALFGVHLAIMSAALWRAPHIPAWLALPVALAGLSYVIIFLGRYFAPDLNLTWLLLLALGELALMVWLLAVGWRRRSPEQAAL